MLEEHATPFTEPPTTDEATGTDTTDDEATGTGTSAENTANTAGPGHDSEPTDEAQPGHQPDPDDPDVVGELDIPAWENDADDPPPAPPPCSACGQPAPAGRTTRTDPGAIDPRRLLPPPPSTSTYIHLAEQSLRRTGPQHAGVARCERVGPITLTQVREFLGHTNVRVVPVLDLAALPPVDGYEVPATMRDAVHLRNPACIAPWGTNRSQHQDINHVKPYLPTAQGGPPGQTNMDNLAPLSRFPHRVKTHGRWTLTQTGPGTYEWRTPHGYRYRVDNQGTHPLGKHKPAQHAAPQPPHDPVTDPTAPRGQIIHADNTHEIYQADLTLDLTNWQHTA